MPNLAHLREEHAAIVRLVKRLDDIVGQSTPPPELDLFSLRRELASTLIAHLKSEDWLLYPRLIECGDPEVSALATEFNEEMGGLAGAFLEYNKKWSAPAIAADWPGYCAETRAIIEALTCRITRENRDLYPLLEALDKAA